MDIFTNHIIDWIVIVALLIGAMYTMRVIGEEKSTFIKDSYLVRFGELNLMIPNWWTITKQKPESLKFERTDTRYEWFALFQHFPDSENKTLPQLLEDKLNLEKIEFDSDVIFETDSRLLFRNKKTQEEFQEVIRVEGKASQNVEERIYYDIYLLKKLNSEGYFIFESRSSVLNGPLEGPYFEESLSELNLIHETESA